MCLLGRAFTVLMLLYVSLMEQNAQLHQGLSLELTDALTRHPQLFAYLGKRVAVPIADTEAQGITVCSRGVSRAAEWQTWLELRSFFPQNEHSSSQVCHSAKK